jgi:hypothetical protein
MNKKLPFSLCLLLAVTMSFGQITFPPGGPNRKASVSQQIGITDVRIDYNRPVVNGREGKIWGELVLMKPKLLRMTSHGAGIQVFRTSRLSGMTAEDFPPTHLVNETPMLIQQFVDTGPLPQKYRALTLCGDVLYIARDTNVGLRPDLSASDNEIEAGKFHNDGSGEVKIDFGNYPEIYAFAQRMAAALLD